MKHIVYNSNQEIGFSQLKDPEALLGSISDGKLTVEQAQNKQKAFHKYFKK